MPILFSFITALKFSSSGRISFNLRPVFAESGNKIPMNDTQVIDVPISIVPRVVITIFTIGAAFDLIDIFHGFYSSNYLLSYYIRFYTSPNHNLHFIFVFQLSFLKLIMKEKHILWIRKRG